MLVKAKYDVKNYGEGKPLLVYIENKIYNAQEKIKMGGYTVKSEFNQNLLFSWEWFRKTFEVITAKKYEISF